MTMSLESFFKQLDAARDRIPLRELVAMMRELDVEFTDFEPYIRFSDDHYQRNLMREGPGYHALILCWSPGQRSPIHDHRGSCCGVRVLQGVATETTFRQVAGGRLVPGQTHQMAAGAVCGSQDDDIHEVSNLHDENLVTMHVYTPPLLKMGTYSLDGLVRVWEDPVHKETSELVG